MRDERPYFTLRVIEQGVPLRTHRLGEGTTSIGRSARENAVVIQDARVSLHHVKVGISGPTVRLTDLGSTNGTYLLRLEGGNLAAPRRLEPNYPVNLAPGDEVRLGDLLGPQLRLELEPVLLERIAGPLPLAVPGDPPRVQFLERMLRRMDLSGLVEALVGLVLESFPEPENVIVWGRGDDPIVQARRIEGGFERARAPLPFSRTVLAHVRASVEVVVFGTPLPEELDSASLRAARIVSGFCAPLVDAKGEVVGVIQADSRTKPFIPGRAQLEEVARLGRAAGAVLDASFAAEETKRSAQELERETESLRRELGDRHRLQRIVGRHPAIASQLALAARVSQTTAPVLVTGETGTGKELVARAIHAASPRAKAPFVAVNCAELPATLAESELFGYERGAFTGADRPKPGLFELAAQGTLFLDEIGEATLALQAMLLRAIERNEVRRVGGHELRPVDVRVIAATNRDLEAEVARGTFRRDLFFRLNVFPIQMPPLRERREDIPELVEHVLSNLRARLGRPDLRVAPAAIEALVLDPWPGNVRELENRLLRASILAVDGEIRTEHVLPPGAEPRTSALDSALALLPLKEARDEFMKVHVRHALEVAHGNKKEAARLLQVDPSNLSRTMKRLGMLTDDAEAPASDPSLEF